MMLKLWQRLALWQKIALGFALGVLVGCLFGEHASWVAPLGEAYVKLIKMLVVPLVFFAIIHSVTAMGAEGHFKRLGLKTLGLFLFTAICASVIGLVIGSLFDWSFAATLSAGAQPQKTIPAVSDVFLNFIPSNPVQAMSQGNVIQLILFAALVGLAMNAIGEVAAPVKKVVDSATQIMFQLTRFVIQLTPIGVFGLMADVVGSYGLSALLPLAQFILAIYIACVLHMTFVYGGLVKVSGFSVRRFFQAIFPAQMVAFTTSSSYGTLPVSTKVVNENLKVSENYTSFVLPLGATVNMDGCGGIYPAISAIFIAHLYGIPLEWLDYLLIVLTATLASVGTAGVPGTALVMLTVTLNAVGLPLEGIAFIAAIDRVLDMIRTTTNVTGDMMVALVVGKSEGLVDLQASQARKPPSE